MIKFLTDKTVSLIRYGRGSIVSLPAPIEMALIAEGAAGDFLVVSKPIELLSSSAVAASCVSIAVDEVLASFTISAGTLGVNSILQIEPCWTFTNTANNKILRIKVGGVSVYTSTRTTSEREGPLFVIANRNSLSSQIHPYTTTYFTAGSGVPATSTINFAVDQSIQITGQRANAGDSLTLEYYRMSHFIGD